MAMGMWKLLLGLALSGVLAVGCAGPEGAAPPPGEGATTTPPAPTATVTAPPATLPDIPSQGEPIVGEIPASILQAIKADLSARAGVGVTSIEVVEAKAVLWPDGSLGCPEPGMFYIQVLTEGYQVILRAVGREYDYRATQQGAFKLCEAGGSGPGGLEESLP
jgi:hypothetical protein